MRRQLPLIGGALAIVFVGLAAACGSDPVTRSPVGPGGVPFITGLQISGPASVAPGQSVQFTAATRLSDGTVKTSTGAQNLRWRTTNTAALQVSEAGLVTGGANGGEATVSVEVVGSPGIRGAREVLVLPVGTFRLVGLVADAEFPTHGIGGARVEVSGTSVAATADAGGNFRIYGVPPAAEIRISASGYAPAFQTVQLNANTTRNFHLTLSGPRFSLHGTYTLAVDVGACSQLSADLQHRRYDASITTNGTSVNVVLTEPRFRTAFGSGNSFSGRTDPTGVTFELASFYRGFYYYYYYYPNVVERLPNNTYLVVTGRVRMSSTGAGATGPLSGSIINYDPRFPSQAVSLGNCSSNIQLTLTPR
jgi:hypothetical protein